MTKIFPSINIKLMVFDFDGVFTDNTVYVSESGFESVRCFRGDGLGLTRIRSIGIQVAILSTEKNPVVGARAKKLNIQCYQDIQDKGLVLQQLCEELNVPLEDTLYMGNDINDLPAFMLTGFPVGVADSDPEILEHIIFKTKRLGGFGAVREVCDLLYFHKLKNIN